MSKTYVRCVDRMIFKIDPKTLEPLTCSFYDPWCFSDPRPDTTYIEHSDWCKRRHALRDQAYEADRG